MAFGKRRGGGENVPVLKYDARVGRFYTQDRVQKFGKWQTEQSDCTDGFRAAVDVENVEIGWASFPKGRLPQTVLVPAGEDYGDAPDDDYNEGVRLIALLEGETAAREMLGTSAAIWNALDDLHNDYLAECADHVGMVPVVEVVETVKITGTNGSISYQPKFKIVGWVPRPVEFPATTRSTAPKPKPKPSAHASKAKPRERTDMDDEIPF